MAKPYLMNGEYFTSDMEVDQLYLPIAGSRPLGEFFHTLSGDFHVSSRGKAVFDLFRSCEKIHWIPVTIRRTAGDKTESYWFMHYVEKRKVLHPQLAEVEYVTGSDIILQVNKVVLQRSLIPDVDVFRGERSWFASEPLMEAVQSADLSRFVFGPVEVAD